MTIMVTIMMTVDSDDDHHDDREGQTSSGCMRAARSKYTIAFSATCVALADIEHEHDDDHNDDCDDDNDDYR